MEKIFKAKRLDNGDWVAFDFIYDHYIITSPNVSAKVGDIQQYRDIDNGIDSEIGLEVEKEID